MKRPKNLDDACRIIRDIMDIMQADGVDFAFPSTSVYIEKN